VRDVHGEPLLGEATPQERRGRRFVLDDQDLQGCGSAGIERR